MTLYDKFYINGKWMTPTGKRKVAIVNPCNEEVICHVAMGEVEDVNLAVIAARNAFNLWAGTSVEKR
ncbi:MAG: aldehyde dehydrogenase family protein, partial [Proteobacteria bacterium]|nr:aldehyde dehydrogenase family protein [Pseudomonadota bacterium]